MKKARHIPPCGRRRGALGKVPPGEPSGLVRWMGVVVREEREWQGLSRVALAAAARVDSGMIYRLECGRVVDVGVDFVERLADALGFSFLEIAGLAEGRKEGCTGEASGGPSGLSL